MPVTIEKARVNIFNVIGFSVAIAASAFGWGITYSSMNSADAEAVQQITSVQSEIKDIKAQLPAISQLQYQMTTNANLSSENKKTIEETNKRMDHIVESFGGKLDKLVEQVSNVAADVRVLAAQQRDKAQPTSHSAVRRLTAALAGHP